MNEILQLLAGGFYLLNKIFLWRAECSTELVRYRQWRIWAWSVYMVGLPPCVWLFLRKDNWIAASVEAAGLPAMVLGLILALRGRDPRHLPPWVTAIDRVALLCIPFGFWKSIQRHGGLHTLAQGLEVALVVGFLVGTYLLAKEIAQGYLWFVLMHVACGWLMAIQQLPLMVVQQVVSLIFIVAAYRRTQLRKIRTTAGKEVNA
ncbi:nicotinamide mononucleotide transporter [Candidatus Uhrbacteria bacterium]|nr:nicotinamide mononucleotide transporter [Candidatus Uhrbacteria bacterium]